MNDFDDDTLQIFIEESIEHLSHIENELLEIEDAGADIDEELVNKVYRAAHSIKGGAGFMGLANIKNLTHEMENILGLIRERSLVPTHGVIDVLLKASDTLRDLIHDVSSSNDVDLSEHIRALKEVGGAEEKAPAPAAAPPKAAETPPEPPAPVETGMVRLTAPDGEITFTLEESAFSRVFGEGKQLYMARVDMLGDIFQKNRKPDSLVADMRQTGDILDASLDMDAIGAFDEASIAGGLTFWILFASILQPQDINSLFEIDPRCIIEVHGDQALAPLADGPMPPPVSAAPPPEPEPAPVVDPPPRKAETKPPGKPGEKTSPPVARKPVAETSLRVHVSLLDTLMTLAGELVLSRNQLIQSITSKDQRNLEISAQRVDLITSELQEAIMLTRMQPIGNIFNKFSRVVRDLARDLGKEMELVIEGKDVELDKTIIEGLSDPLTHLVRNAADHGIESPDVRIRSGKSSTGNIFLKAYHEAGQVNIEITDDGKGMDGDVLAKSALNKGLITEEQSRGMSEKEKINLIFMPGFSTAGQITDVSGRGVGMDVVKTNLDKLGGLVDIDSEKGKGSTIRIKLPLTLAIIPSLLVTTGKERYAIPQVNVDELLRIPASQIKKRIEMVGNAEVVRLREKLLPLLSLAEVLDLPKIFINPEDGVEKPEKRQSIADRRSRKSPVFGAVEKTTDQASLEESRKLGDRRYHSKSGVNIVVVTAGAFRYGLVVDELHDSEEIVVKPLGRHLKQCRGYAGATILGDGKVALILDVGNLAQMAKLTSVTASDRASEVQREAENAKKGAKDRQSLLLFRNSEADQFGVPLDLVERVEKIRRTEMEEVGGRQVIQYRGGSLPLFAIQEVANVAPMAESDHVLVIVFTVSGREVGLLAAPPVDSVDITLELDAATLKQPGIMGSAIIGKRTTLLVDIFNIVETLNPEWFADKEETREETAKARHTILFAEDSNFFRSQVKRYLEEDGFKVVEAVDGLAAWEALESGQHEISLVLTDLEMPNLDGYELTEKVKADVRFSHLPVVACTSLAGEEDMAKGRAVGIDDYQIKLDKEKLLESIRSFLS